MNRNWSWIVDMAGRRASFSPNRTALFDAGKGEAFTYSELDRRSCSLAAYLREELGLRKGDKVAVLAQNTVEYFDWFFACQKSGLVLVPLNLRLSVAELVGVMKQTTPKVLAYEHEFASQATQVKEDIELDKMIQIGGDNLEIKGAILYRDMISGSRTFQAPEPIDPEDPLLILFTGGTTGPPKGAIISQRSVYFNSISELISWQLDENTVVPCMLPFFHTGGWNLLTLPVMMAGGKVLINRKFDPGLILHWVEHEHCRILFGAATMYQMIADQEEFAGCDFSSVEVVMSGAAPCPPSVMEPYWEKGVPFTQGYGITEGGPNNLFQDWKGKSMEQIRSLAASVGKPFLYCRPRIVDEEGNTIAGEGTGELLLSGPVIFSGYLNRPQETSRTLVDGWVHTGDVARRDREGNYYIVDRIKDMFISGGENVFPVEVESAICRHPAVREAAVVGIPDSKWGEVGKAFIVLQPEASISGEEIIGFLTNHLARYKIPKQVEFVEAIPKSSVGKVLKRMLKENK